MAQVGIKRGRSEVAPAVRPVAYATLELYAIQLFVAIDESQKGAPASVLRTLVTDYVSSNYFKQVGPPLFAIEADDSVTTIISKMVSAMPYLVVVPPADPSNVVCGLEMRHFQDALLASFRAEYDGTLGFVLGDAVSCGIAPELVVHFMLTRDTLRLRYIMNDLIVIVHMNKESLRSGTAFSEHVCCVFLLASLLGTGVVYDWDEADTIIEALKSVRYPVGTDPLVWFKQTRYYASIQAYSGKHAIDYNRMPITILDAFPEFVRELEM